MIYMMDCTYHSQLIMAEILSQHEGELDLFRGWGVAFAFGHEPLPPLPSFPFTTLWGCLIVVVEVVLVVEEEVVAVVVAHHLIVQQLGDVS